MIGQMINTLDHVQEVLSDEGYKTALIGDAVSFQLGSDKASFLVVITILENELTITCKIAEVSDGDEITKLAELGIAALDLNFSIRPYALAVISNESNAWPLVLTDSLSLGDLSPNELRMSIEGLRGAIHSTADFIRKFNL